MKQLSRDNKSQVLSLFLLFRLNNSNESVTLGLINNTSMHTKPKLRLV